MHYVVLGQGSDYVPRIVTLHVLGSSFLPVNVCAPKVGRYASCLNGLGIHWNRGYVTNGVAQSARVLHNMWIIEATAHVCRSPSTSCM
jgi:hypothetical protein